MPFLQKQAYTTKDYWSLPEGQRAELIDGQFYNMDPPDYIHQKLVSVLHYAIFHYIKTKKGACEVIPAPFAVNLNQDDKTWVEPDISVICCKEKISKRGCKGTPDWIIEVVSPSSSTTDYIIKLFKYRIAGVREYWIVNPMKKAVQVYSFEGNENSELYSFEDEIPVQIFQGLTIKISELL